jgi:hypothetical protein
LQYDLGTIRNDYELLSNNFKEYKKQVAQQHQYHQQQAIIGGGVGAGGVDLSRSPISSSTRVASLGVVTTPSSQGTLTNSLSSHHSINQENENLEEDMRKAKESADMLRSVVLPLETEISHLRNRSNTSDKKIKELEKLIEQVREIIILSIQCRNAPLRSPEFRLSGGIP